MSNSRIRQLAVAMAGLVSAGSARAAIHFGSPPSPNMPWGVTPSSHHEYDLHMMMFYICVVIGVVVFFIMGYSMWRHRRSRGHQASRVHENVVLEVAWTIVPFLILIGVAIPSAATLVGMRNSNDVKMSVKITGYQWLWQYAYMGNNVSFYSKMSESSNKARALDSTVSPWSVPHYLRSVDHPLVLPTHTKIRFLITSGDVIHSWWVPELGVKKDAIPGYVNTVYTTIEKPGVYRGQCAELCGRGHAYMPIVVKAVPPAKFKKWLADQPGYHKKGGKEEKKVHKLEQKEHHNEAPEQTSID